MKRKLFLSVAIPFLAAALVGCEERPEATLVKAQYEQATLIEFDKPKHVYVQFRFDDGAVSDRVWIGKHCGNYRHNVELGKDYNILVKYMKITDEDNKERVRRYLDKSNLYGVFCR